MDMFLLGFGFSIGAVAIPYLIHKYGISDCIKPFTELCKFIWKFLPTKKNKAIKYKKQFLNCGIYDQSDYAIIIFLKELRGSIIDKKFKTYEGVLEFVKNWLPDFSDDTDGLFWLHSCELIFKDDKIEELFKEIVGYLSDEHYLSIDFNSFLELIIPRLNMLIDEFDKRKFLIKTTIYPL